MLILMRLAFFDLNEFIRGLDAFRLIRFNRFLVFSEIRGPQSPFFPGRIGFFNCEDVHDIARNVRHCRLDNIGVEKPRLHIDRGDILWVGSCLESR